MSHPEFPQRPEDPIPDYVYRESAEFRNDVFEGENGAKQVSQGWDTPRRSFTLVYPYDVPDLSTGSSRVIWDFFIRMRGRAGLFTFDPSIWQPDLYDPERILCRFLKDKATREAHFHGSLKLVVELEEEK